MQTASYVTSDGLAALESAAKSDPVLRPMCDVAIVVPSPVTARIQEAHIMIGHTLCGLIEAELGLA